MKIYLTGDASLLEKPIACYVTFGMLAGADMKYRLFKSFCDGMYGCALWHLEDCKISDFCIVWRKSFDTNIGCAI